MAYVIPNLLEAQEVSILLNVDCFDHSLPASAWHFLRLLDRFIAMVTGGPVLSFPIFLL